MKVVKSKKSYNLKTEAMNCIVCNNIINDAMLIDVYFTFTTHTHNLLVNNIRKILNCDLNEPHSKYICKECFSIFEELDLTEFTFTRIKKRIFKRWILTDSESFTKDASCQTDYQFPVDTNCQSNDLFESDSKEFTEIADTVLLEAIKKETDLSFDNDTEGNTEKSNIEKNTRSKTRDKENKSYQCTTCKKRFVSKNGMNLHIQRQHQNEHSSSNKATAITNDSLNIDCNVVIEDCSKTEPDSNLDSQIDDDSISNNTKSTTVTSKKKVKKENLSTIRPLKYSCPQCPKMWRTMGELRNHIATHSSLRPYICEVCGQAYKHKSALDIHVGMHNGINPFSCNYCHKAFTQKGALQRHLPIHTGEAPYQCDLCGKRFVHHTSFNMHTLAHTGQKSYKCKLCGLALLSGSHLKRHMRVHTGERPYACVQCGKRFAERYNLAAHQRLHEAGPSELSKRLYRCQVCGAGFDRRPKLEEHLSNNHNKISENDPSRKWVGHILNNV